MRTGRAPGVIARDGATELLRALPYPPLRVQHPRNAGDAGFRQRPKAELGEQAVKVLPVQQLDADLRVAQAQLPQLAVLLRNQRLLHRGELEIEVEVWEIKVRRHHLQRSVVLPLQRKRRRLILPAQAVEIEYARELFLAGMREQRASPPRGGDIGNGSRRAG